MSRCQHCGYDDLIDRSTSTERHIVHLLEGITTLMTDFIQAEADAETEITTLLTELLAAVKASTNPDPAVQAAADKLEAFLAATKAADPTPVPGPPADTTPPPVDTTPPTDSTPVADTPVPDGGTPGLPPSTLGTES